MNPNNLFECIPETAAGEIFETIIKKKNFKLERIISEGQATPPGEWYDQDRHEWVIVLQGSAGLQFKAEAEIRIMKAGDWINIPAHKKHRVEWTDAEQKTIWLALHYD